LDNTATNTYAEIIIPLALPLNYTWQIPEQYVHQVAVGVRVEVELRNKKYSGIIKSIHHNKPEAFTPKAINQVLDDAPILHPVQLKFWEWISNYYLCSEGEVMQAALPANLKLSGESVLSYNEELEELPDNLSDYEYLVAEALQIRKELRMNEVQQILEATHVYPIIKKLIEKRICFVWEELKEKFKPKKETYIELHKQYKDESNLEALFNSNILKSAKQTELLLAYLYFVKTEGEVKQSELLKKSGATAAQLKGLIEKNILYKEVRAVDRIAFMQKDIAVNFELSEVQLLAAKQIEQSFQEKPVCLLHGVTASGKTQIYVKLIEEFIASGKQVLYMLPEIALTAQIIRRLQIYFGGNIGIYHSKFNSNERVEIWQKVKTGELKIVLGARSSIFLPFKDLGLIIVDEEHDTSYKQVDPAPRYNARDAAIYYASLSGAKVLLGSATPSIESYFNASNNKFGLVTLSERFGNVNLPAIEIVDLKKVYTAGNVKTALAPAMIEAIQQTLNDKKQVIVFQNRRGYSPYILCKSCGWIPHCTQCDVTLTYHKSKNQLNCHYCGANYPMLHTCAACGNHDFIQKNFGTEKLEEIICEQFPDAKVSRMDYDTVKGKHDHDILIKQFEQQKIDILVGTQMVVKGLDFEHVNLVGIVDADGILNFTDFRVNERSFQLMEQVSGRAGRKDGIGKVLIQVSNVHHPVLHFLMTHDYQKMYLNDLEGRKAHYYPPYTRLIKLTFKHKNNGLAQDAALQFKEGMDKLFRANITGPAQPVIERIRNLFLWDVLIKLPKDNATVLKCKHTIHEQIALLKANQYLRNVGIHIDVDPI